jgi:type II secretory pathway component GspD/PulD (secretin)
MKPNHAGLLAAILGTLACGPVSAQAPGAPVKGPLGPVQTTYGVLGGASAAVATTPGQAAGAPAPMGVAQAPVGAAQPQAGAAQPPAGAAQAPAGAAPAPAGAFPVPPGAVTAPVGAAPAVPARPLTAPEKRGELLSMSFRDAPIQEVFEMLARGERVNIILRKGVAGNVSVNLYNVSVSQAVQSIAEAGGYVVEQPRPGDYIIVERGQAGLDAARSGMVVKSYKVQYSNPKFVADILSKHVSRQGKITPLLERNMLVVEDHTEYHARISQILRDIDVEPKQIMIEAKILEITLDEGETFGIDWTKIFNTTTGSSFGVQGLATRNIPGLFFNIVNDKVTAYLSALSAKGRVHTLSTPKLLALEYQEATVMIGDRTGYKVTTTINLVTNETVQFLDTGVILRVIPSVDERGRIMMKIHPEVSSGSISDGIPSKKSTEVTTQLLAEDGQAILIGGLIKRDRSLRRNGVPILGDLPIIGNLFANKDERTTSSETVVLITPRIVRSPAETVSADDRERLLQSEQLLLRQTSEINDRLDRKLPAVFPETQPNAAPPAPK